MKVLNYANLAKKILGLAGLVVAGTVVALPTSAQVPAAPVEPSLESAPETDAPLPEAAPTSDDVAPTDTPDAVEPTLDGAESTVEEISPDDASTTEEAAETETPETDPTAETEPAEETPAEAEAPASEETPAEAEAPASEEAPAEAEIPAPEEAPGIAATTGTIVDVAAASETFQTLVSALTEAELAELLGGEGPFTVFAPTDEAFAALPEGMLEELLKPENRELLVQILTYHVVPGAVTSDQLTSGEVATVEGSPVNVTVSEEAVTVNDANVIEADIPATNGVIHAIDSVILPPALEQ
jgi:uncharacterized surface protein with fasciclin (FAS1) repeats